MNEAQRLPFFRAPARHTRANSDEPSIEGKRLGGSGGDAPVGGVGVDDRHDLHMTAILAEALDSLPDDASSPEERCRQALALHDEGVALQRMNLRRRHPSVSEDQIERLLGAWLLRADDE